MSQLWSALLGFSVQLPCSVSQCISTIRSGQLQHTNRYRWRRASLTLESHSSRRGGRYTVRDGVAGLTVNRSLFLLFTSALIWQRYRRSSLCVVYPCIKIHLQIKKERKNIQLIKSHTYLSTFLSTGYTPVISNQQGCPGMMGNQILPQTQQGIMGPYPSVSSYQVLMQISKL